MLTEKVINMSGKVIARLVGLVILIGLVFFVYISFFSTKSYSITQGLTVPSFFSDSAYYGNNSIIFSNGRAFVKYNYTTGQSSILGSDSSQLYLNNIDSISLSPDNNFILFHDPIAPSGSVLSSDLQQQNLNQYQDYWWVYDISSGTFSPLPAGTLMAKFSGNEVYGLVGGNGNGNNETITTYFDNNLSKVRSVTIPGSSNFFVANGGLVLQEPNNNILFTNNGVINTLLLTSTTLVGTSSDGSKAIGTETINGVENLCIVNLVKGSSKVVATNIIGTPSWSGTDLVAYVTKNSKTNAQEIKIYNIDNNKTVYLNLANNINISNGNVLQAVNVFSRDSLLMSNSKSGYFLIGNGLASIKTPPAGYYSYFEVAGNPITIKYDSTNNNFLVTLNLSDISQEQPDVYQEISAAGYDPNLTDINFSAPATAGDSL
jgi:hypothetical protein